MTDEDAGIDGKQRRSPLGVLADRGRRHEDGRMSGGTTVTIYVFLLDEGVNVWRPVSATHIRSTYCRITSDRTSSEFSEEQWQFATGDIVRCEERELSEGRALVAIERVEGVF